MAIGVSDGPDVAAWLAPARAASATGRRDAGAAARTAPPARERFGEALARVDDERPATAARPRATQERERTAPETRSETRPATRMEATSRRAADAAERSASASPRVARQDSHQEARQAVRRPDEPQAAPVDPASPPVAARASPPRQDADATPSPDAQDGAAEGTAQSRDATVAQAGGATIADGADQAVEGTKRRDAADRPTEGAAAQVAPPAVPTPLVTLLVALSGGGASVAADASETGTAGAAPIRGATGRATGLPGASLAVPADAGTASAGAGSGAAPSMPAAGLSEAAARPAPSPDGAAVAPVGGTDALKEKGQAETLPASGKLDFLTALADAGRDATQGTQNGAQGGAQAGPAPIGASVASGSAHAPAPVAQAAVAAQAPPPVPVGQVPMTIGLRSLAGSSEFQIRLDPAELGRIDVKLEIDKARGTVTTHLVVDRAETLALLQRDAPQLQQALSQAGLDASGGLDLSLRGDGGAGAQSGGREGQARGNAWAAEANEAVQEAVPMRALRGYGGLDIRI